MKKQETNDNGQLQLEELANAESYGGWEGGGDIVVNALVMIQEWHLGPVAVDREGHFCNLKSL